jgi:hypothetical protein
MRVVRIQNQTMTIETLPADGGLDALQALVGGDIEGVAHWDGERDGEHFSLFGHAEARIIGLPLTCLVELPSGRGFIDMLGPVVLCGCDADGEDRDLTDAEIMAIRLIAREGFVPLLQVAPLTAPQAVA